MILVITTCVCGLGVGLWSAVKRPGPGSLKVFVVQFVIGGMVGFAISLLTFSLLFRRRDNGY